jgi:serine/threonine protein kinase
MEVADLPVSERATALDDACNGDAALRTEVESLLRAESQARGFMGSPTAADGAAQWETARSATTAATAREEPGQMIGRYKLLQPLGEGGFGSVWMAEQREPVKRRVALKIIKLGMDTKQVIARFEAERQALATMDHPNIAKVLDAGSTETGRPYFVMEYIKGVSIVDYCDTDNLDTTARLELFSSVCHAIHHAHQKGIIHRDIKPSNVLVTMHDGVPVPRVIDFGIAKATSSELTQKTLFTEHRQMIGTPAYMSPEQAEMSGLDIDTRSDIYSLGVLLYELLTGTTPFGHEELLSKGYAEMMRIIREVEPAPPSTRLSSLGDAGARREQQRPAGDARRLGLLLRGDLDWIAMKCLEKDRTRRYESASALAADVQRHLTGEPVIAAPPSRMYRLSKTLRRHRAAAVVTAGIVVFIGAALAATSTLWRQAAHARDAESDQRARAAAVSAFLSEMLTAAEPARAKGARLTVREALDTAASNIMSGQIKNQPLVEAEIRFIIGSTYFALGLYSQAEAQLREAETTQARELGDEHRDTLLTRSKIAETLLQMSDYWGSAAIAQPTFEAQARVLGPDDPRTLQTMVTLGRVLWAQPGRFFDAESLLRAAIERLERVRGPNHVDTAAAIDALGEAYQFNSYPDKAEPLHLRALQIHTEQLGQEHPATLYSLFYLAGALSNLSRNEEAEGIQQKVLEARVRILGPEHVDTLASQQCVALALARQGRNVEAETLYRDNLEAMLRIWGPSHSNTIHGQRFLADCLEDQGKYEEAITLLRQALESARAKFGPEDADTSIRIMCELASQLARQRQDDEAEQVAREVLEYQRRQSPRATPGEFALSSSTLIRVLRRRGEHDEALQLEKELTDFWLAAARAPDAVPKDIDGAARRLLSASEHLRDHPLALELALRANELSGHRNAYYMGTLAEAYVQNGDSRRAGEVWRQASDLLTEKQARASMLNAAAWDLLTITPENLRDPAVALELALQANELSGYANPPALDTLALACHRTGDTARAIELQQKAIALLAADAPDLAEYQAQLREFQSALEGAANQRAN